MKFMGHAETRAHGGCIEMLFARIVCSRFPDCSSHWDYSRGLPRLSYFIKCSTSLASASDSDLAPCLLSYFRCIHEMLSSVAFTSHDVRATEIGRDRRSADFPTRESKFPSRGTLKR